MVALIMGIILILFTIFSALPPDLCGFGLGWGPDILLFLRGGLPLFTVLIGFVSIFIGLADIKDKKEDREEEQLAQKSSEDVVSDTSKE